MIAKYGLPLEIRYCKKCVISNQRPNSVPEHLHTIDQKKPTIQLDSEGVCSACRVAEQKKNIDWKERELQLRALCNKYRKNDGSYDVLIPGSGGKDSFMQCWLMKHKYGMHPLTCTWAPGLYTPWGQRNHKRWTMAGFDNYLLTGNGRVHRLLTRLAVDTLFHPFQSFIYLQKTIAPKMAILHKIPFIMGGENEAEYGNPIADTTTSLRDKSYYSHRNQSEIMLSGIPVQRLIDEYGLTKNDLSLYMPINPESLDGTDIQVHYLSYYERWHPQGNYYGAVEHGGFEAAPERTAATFSRYSGIDDRLDDFHFYCTLVKFGLGRCSYDASQEIRSGEIDRDEGVALCRRFDMEFPERWVNEFLDYISIPEKEFSIAHRRFVDPIMTRQRFDALADTFRSEHLWTKESGQWQLRKPVWECKSESMNVPRQSGTL